MVADEKQPLLKGGHGESVVVEVEGAPPRKKMERRAFCISLFMLIISIPALIGS